LTAGFLPLYWNHNGTNWNDAVTTQTDGGIHLKTLAIGATIRAEVPMKTADSIEQQEERKAARNNGNGQHSLRENTQPVTQKRRRGDASYTARIAPFKWRPGQSGNPGGRPKHDLAAEIARAIFENNAPMIYEAYRKMLRKGNAYAFQVLSERAFGKLKESIQHEISPYREMSDEELRERIKQLEQQLGVSYSDSELLPPTSESKPD